MSGPLSQREAAQRWAIPWTTFRRAVKAGKVSIGADKRVDPAEMVRAFGEPTARAESGTTGPDGTNTESLEKRDPATFYQHNYELMKAEIAALRALLEAKDANLADLRSQVRLLTHASAPRRRWWPFR